MLLYNVYKSIQVKVQIELTSCLLYQSGETTSNEVYLLHKRFKSTVSWVPSSNAQIIQIREFWQTEVLTRVVATPLYSLFTYQTDFVLKIFPFWVIVQYFCQYKISVLIIEIPQLLSFIIIWKKNIFEYLPQTKKGPILLRFKRNTVRLNKLYETFLNCV